MKLKQKKSQVTIFLIIGLVMIIIVVSLVLLSRYAAKKTSKQETLDIKESSFDVQPIKNFVVDCLSFTSKNGLKTLGKQGGYLFKSQGGTLIDYQNSDEGLFFVEYEDSKVVYNIMKSRFSVGKYVSSVPDYPWRTFPYVGDGMAEKEFLAKSAFGTNNLPPINKSFGQNSMQAQLETYVPKNIDQCLDFFIFEEQGFQITKGDKSVAVDINDNDVVFRMKYNMVVDNLVSGEKTELGEFFVRQQIRLGKIRFFVNRLIESDIGDIEFNISQGNNADSMFVSIRRDVYNNDDVIIITDEESKIDGFPLKYVFARKNRNPALSYLFPIEITLDALDDEGNLAEITRETLIGNQKLEAFDPDEDLINEDSFSIDPEVPKELSSTDLDFKVKVTDGSLEDYQTIVVKRG